MPVYEYQCKQCNFRFDQSQQFNEPPLLMCPNCGKESLKKVFSAVGIVFKGSGFYKNDSRSQTGSASTQSKVPTTDSVVSGDVQKQGGGEVATQTQSPAPSSTASDSKSTSSDLATSSPKE